MLYVKIIVGKPELWDAGTYSLVNYNEFERVVADYNRITAKADSINQALPEAYRDAFYQLILYPTKASANLLEMYYALAQNRYFAAQGAVVANDWAQKVKEDFSKDSLLSIEYQSLGNRKWQGMMNQSHIGYTSWNDPPRNIMPKTEEVLGVADAMPGISIEGYDPLKDAKPEIYTLPEFSTYTRESHWIELFNKGLRNFSFQLKPTAKWLKVSAVKGTVEKETKLFVSVDWTKVPYGEHVKSQLKIKAAGKTFVVNVSVSNPEQLSAGNLKGFVESNGVVSIEAEHYSTKTEGKDVSWEKIPGLGRTLSAMLPLPATAPSLDPVTNENSLQYQVYFFSIGTFPVSVYISPTINFKAGESMRLAVALDHSAPQILEVKAGTINGTRDDPSWEESVRNNIRKLVAKIHVDEPGYHTLRIIMVDPVVPVQKIVINTGGEKSSYLGPLESYYH